MDNNNIHDAAATAHILSSLNVLKEFNNRGSHLHILMASSYVLMSGGEELEKELHNKLAEIVNSDKYGNPLVIYTLLNFLQILCVAMHERAVELREAEKAKNAEAQG